MLNNDPNDMGGNDWQGENLSEAIFDLSTRLLKERARELEERVKKLVTAGIPIYRIQLLELNDCECHGSGIVIKEAMGSIEGHTCQSCLGLSMVVDKRTVP